MKGVVDEEALERHAEMFAARLRKRFRHLAPRFGRRNVEAFRVYDWDIPEVRATVDWYAGHLVIAEYVREQTSALPWLERMADAAAEALLSDLPAEQRADRLHLKRRTTGKRGHRYGRLSRRGCQLEVREADQRFWVDLESFVDTGLFPDHRETRALVGRDIAELGARLGRAPRFLNLYAYTGSFSVYAARAGAQTTTVDLSKRYLAWAERNFELNALEPRAHRFLEEDIARFLSGVRERRARWDYVVVDPPSFSSVGNLNAAALDIQRDHPELLRGVAEVLEPGGTILFSTNHQRFEPRLEGFSRRFEIREISQQVQAEDFARRAAHRCFLLRSRA
ncbi:MAG: class I SAM-dependent methyltransferase [Myxococcales bacterium]|nr:class I SAM-dependent methyltransferase [Myxococcales bacterium]